MLILIKLLLSYSDYTSILLTDLFMSFWSYWLYWYNQNNSAWSGIDKRIIPRIQRCILILVKCLEWIFPRKGCLGYLAPKNFSTSSTSYFKSSRYDQVLWVYRFFKAFCLTHATCTCFKELNQTTWIHIKQ